jgi:alpha-ketoglutarate-dependent taurine dioxygenase
MQTEQWMCGLSHPMGADTWHRSGQPSRQTYREIRQALNEHGVIFFRDQTSSRSTRFPSVSARSKPRASGIPFSRGEVRKGRRRRNIGGNWHVDHSFDPCRDGCRLVARELLDCGGDTLGYGQRL